MVWCAFVGAGSVTCVAVVDLRRLSSALFCGVSGLAAVLGPAGASGFSVGARLLLRGADSYGREVYCGNISSLALRCAGMPVMSIQVLRLLISIELLFLCLALRKCRSANAIESRGDYDDTSFPFASCYSF